MPSFITTRLATYVPDRPPTWTEVLLGIITSVNIGAHILSPVTLSWPAVAAGFLAFSVALGPASQSAHGRQLGQWFRNIGVTGRGILIVLAILITAVVLQFDAVPHVLIGNAGSGGLVAGLVYQLIHIISAGEISGWKIAENNQ